MVRIAVLGAGFMGGTHARAYGGMPGVEIAAIYARGGSRAEPLANDLGTTWTDDLDRLLSDPSIDSVDICLPTPEHRRATEAAIAAGKHVIVEKPLALTLEDADALVAASAVTDKVVMVAHVLRFWPEYVELHRTVASGELGRPLSAVATRRQPFPAWSELFTRADLTGGAVVDMLIHDYDALNWIFGTPKSVVSHGHKNARSSGWDQTQVLIDYGDSSAVVDGGMTMPDSYPFSSSLQVLCERGAIEYHFRAGGRSVEMGAGVNDLTLYPEAGDPVRLEVPQSDPYTAECA
jgi:predicted dehydrogenase